MIGKYFPPVPGGIEQYVAGLAALAAEDTRLTVLVHAVGMRSSTVVADGYRLIRRGSWMKVGSQPISPGMALDMLRERYDLIHLHVPNVFAVALVLMFSRGARIVVTHHADMVGFGRSGRLAEWLYRKLLSRTHMVTLLSLANQAIARDIDGAGVELAALPVALDPRRYVAANAVAARVRALRRQHAEAAALFVFVGRLVSYKGVDVLIDALAQAPGIHCLIVGDGPLRATLEARALALGVARRVSFLGAVDAEQKLAALHAADALVLPSVSAAETFGIVQVEAQLCGLPVVASDLPTGVTDVTRHGETGLLAPPGDARALAAAMSRLANNKDLRVRLGALGRARALTCYTPAAVRPALLDIYARALKGQNAIMPPPR